MSDELSPRARAILDAAERLAGEQTPSTEDQIAALAEQVRLTVDAVRARIDDLNARVDALAAQLTQPTPTPPPTPAPAPPPPPPRVVPEPPPPPLPPTPDPDDAPRLLAVELAVAGATRADVDARLRARFGVSSTAELLDEVFGVGSSPSARLPWGGASP